MCSEGRSDSCHVTFIVTGRSFLRRKKDLVRFRKNRSRFGVKVTSCADFVALFTTSSDVSFSVTFTAKIKWERLNVDAVKWHTKSVIHTLFAESRLSSHSGLNSRSNQYILSFNHYTMDNKIQLSMWTGSTWIYALCLCHLLVRYILNTCKTVCARKGKLACHNTHRLPFSKDDFTRDKNACCALPCWSFLFILFSSWLLIIGIGPEKTISTEYLLWDCK